MDIAPDVRIGPFSFVRERTKIGPGTRIGDHFQSMGDNEIGKDCRFHSNVHVGKGSKIGDRVFIGPGFVHANVRYPFAGNPAFKKTEGITIDDDAKIGSGVVALPGVRIGKHALVGAGSVVVHDVPDYAVVVGNPARVIGDTRSLKAYSGDQENLGLGAGK